MKKIALLIASCSLVSLSATVLADPPNTNSGRFHIGFDVGATEPGNSWFEYAKTSDKRFYVNPEFDPTYGFDADYSFPEKGSDLGVGYHHSSLSNSSSADGSLTLRNSQSATTATGRYDEKIDRFDIFAGHRLNFGNYFDVDLSGGLEYGKYSNDLRTSAKNGSTVLDDVVINNDFRGWGPEFGMMGICHPPIPALGNHDGVSPFSVYGGINSGLMYGMRESKTNFSNAPSIDQDVIIPNIGADLGINYRMNKYLDVSAGYNVRSYMGAFIDADTRLTHDLHTQTPYLRANLSFQ